MASDEDDWVTCLTVERRVCDSGRCWRRERAVQESLFAGDLEVEFGPFSLVRQPRCGRWWCR